MINKENKQVDNSKEKSEKNGFVDTAKMNMNGHILIKDKDTGKVLTNKRG